MEVAVQIAISRGVRRSLRSAPDSHGVMRATRLRMSKEDYLGHPADFRVKYRFRTEAEGGRKILPSQGGYRGDFLYEEDDRPDATIYMIHPEFENAAGVPVPEDEQAEIEGTARMWILVDKMRPVHRDRIRPGVRGFIVEGSRKVASVEVNQVLGLHTSQLPRIKLSGDHSCRKCGGKWPSPGPIAHGVFRLVRDLIDQHRPIHAIAELRRRTGCSLTSAKGVKHHLGTMDGRCHECNTALDGPSPTDCSSCGAFNYWQGADERAERAVTFCDSPEMTQ